jgi:Flp pilus assembly protein TadB
MTPGAEQATTIGERSSPTEPPAPTDSPSRGLRRPVVSPWLRAALLGLGGALIAVGVAGLVLPGIQGVVTILAGLVVVSLGSHTAHRRMRRGLRRWPRALDAYEGMRRRLRRRFRGRRRP